MPVNVLSKSMEQTSLECAFENGMTKTFVSSLRELFDVLDDQKTGVIRFGDIARKWVEDDSVPDLPKGLIKSLRKVSPSNGMLTFDRFCAGVRICLLKNQADHINNNNGNNNADMNGLKCPRGDVPCMPSSSPPAIISSPSSSSSHPTYYNLKSRSHSSALNSSHHSNHDNHPEVFISKPTASVSPVPPLPSSPAPLLPQLPTTATTQQLIRASHNHDLTGFNSDNNSSSTANESTYPRTKSLPQLQQKLASTSSPAQGNNNMRHFQSDAKIIPNHKNNSKTKNNIAKTGSNRASPFSKTNIMKTLQNWRDNVLGRQCDEDVNGHTINGHSVSKEDLRFDAQINRSPNRIPLVEPKGAGHLQTIPMHVPSLKRPVSKRREPRRHTVGANGIDYNTLRRYQQIEQEREILLHGLDSVHRAREWYLKHIGIVQDKLRFVGRDGSCTADYSLDAFQERINFLAARILTVNQHLAALVDNQSGFPTHMNLALRSFTNSNKPQLAVNPNVVNRLKDQNRMLTDEVARKSDRITQLECEKSALIRELFVSRSQSNPKGNTNNADIDIDDTTFM